MIIIKNMRNHAKEIQYTLSKGPRKMSKMMEKGVKIENFRKLRGARKLKRREIAGCAQIRDAKK